LRAFSNIVRRPSGGKSLVTSEALRALPRQFGLPACARFHIHLARMSFSHDFRWGDKRAVSPIGS
jgi:hypothetical protein